MSHVAHVVKSISRRLNASQSETTRSREEDYRRAESTARFDRRKQSGASVCDHWPRRSDASDSPERSIKARFYHAIEIPSYNNSDNRYSIELSCPGAYAITLTSWFSSVSCPEIVLIHGKRGKGCSAACIHLAIRSFILLKIALFAFWQLGTFIILFIL